MAPAADRHRQEFRPINPFGSSSTKPGALAYRTAPEQSATPSWLAELAEQVLKHRRSVIVGSHGSGKTTLLRMLEPQLRDLIANLTTGDERHPPLQVLSVTARIGERPSDLWIACSQLAPDCVLILDGFEQLSLISRMRLAIEQRRRQFKLLVTSHQPLRNFHSLIITHGDKRIAKELADTLLADHPSRQERVLKNFSEHWAQCGGNLRELWSRLYDEFELSLRQQDKTP